MKKHLLQQNQITQDQQGTCACRCMICHALMINIEAYEAVEMSECNDITSDRPAISPAKTPGSLVVCWSLIACMGWLRSIKSSSDLYVLYALLADISAPCAVWLRFIFHQQAQFTHHCFNKMCLWVFKVFASYMSLAEGCTPGRCLS